MTRTDVSFEPVRFADLPGWETDDHSAALVAFLKSCDVLTTRSADAGADIGRLVGEARSADGSAPAARRFFESWFTPHRVLHSRSNGLLTGYYEPVLPGSRTRHGRYQVPIYRRPADLVNLVNESMRGAAGEALTHARRTEEGRLVPYPTRAEIESGALSGRGLELVYLADAVDAFFVHIQGSALIEFEDGSSVRLSYDGKNGHPYTSIGRRLVEAGVFAAEEITLDALKVWLRADPAAAQQVMWQNASYIFFRELTGTEAKSALGAEQIPLTAGRSLAVDASVHRLGLPIYVVAPELNHTAEGGPFQRLMIAQDVGSAIKGPERGDIYFGTGDAAGRWAGMTRHAGNFFALLPRARRVPKTP